MLCLSPPNRFAFKYSNWGTASTAPGVTVTPGASNVEGSWTAMASSANIAVDMWGFLIWVAGGNVSGQSRAHVLDVGVDNAGGTTYTAKITDLICGQSGNAVDGGRFYYFPLFIKAGSSVAVRIQGDGATAGTMKVGMTFYGRPTHPESVWVGSYSESIGTITSTVGVGFTPGNTGTKGSWQSLGATTKRLSWWQLGVAINNNNTTAQMYFIDLAYGDATNKIAIIENYPILMEGTVEKVGSIIMPEGFAEVPEATNIYVRGACSGTAVSGFNANAIGIG